MNPDRFLPPGVAAAEVAARLGLVSDTHMPQRCADFPPALFEVLEGVDLLLHAGDVGELWVLDRLSAIAPLVAVHGNDTTEDAQRALPYSQVVTVAGERIYLWHSHYPDWAEEMNSRRGDDLPSKLARTVEAARSNGAAIAVFGHWHIPLVYQQNGVTVINPGAIASGNEISRQLHQTVALLFLMHDGQAHVTHVDLACPDRPFDPVVDFDAGFKATLARYSTTILDPALSAAVPYLRANLPPQEVEELRQLVLGLAQRCWAGEFEELTVALFTVEAERSGMLTDEARTLIEQIK